MKKFNLLIYILLLSVVGGFAQPVFDQTTPLTCLVDVSPADGVADDVDISFSSFAVPADSATIWLYFQGDFNGFNEDIDVVDEAGNVLATTPFVGQCSATLDTLEFKVSSGAVIPWILNGSIDFTLEMGGGVNIFCGTPCEAVSMRLFYPISQSGNDAAVTSADSTFPYCAGSHPITATIANLGANQIDSVDVHWEVNGVAQPTFLLRNLLDTVNGASAFDTTLIIGNANLKAGSDTITIWTTNPNGGLDTVNFNDTIRFTVSSSPEPWDYFLSNVTPTTVDVNASFVGDLEIEWGTAGFAIGTGTRDTTNSSPYTVTGLMSGTDYDIWIRTNCDTNDQSAWRRRSITTSFTTPYFQDFEAFTVPTVGNPWPEAWSSSSNTWPRWESEDANGFNENSVNTGPLFDHTNFGAIGGNYIYWESWFPFGLDSGDLWSPPIFVPANQSVIELSFWYFLHGAETQQLQVLVDTNGVENLVGVLVGEQQGNQSDEWIKHSIFLHGYSGKSVSIRFRAFLDVFQLQSDLSDYAIDDVAIDTVPTVDASLESISNPSGALCPGTITPSVVVRNRGVNTLTSVDIVSDINGVLDTTTASVNIITGDTAWVNLNSTTFSSGIVYDLDFYLIGANGSADLVADNDSVDLRGITTGLAGAITLDPSLSSSATNFTSFDSLAFALNNVGICGNVTVTVAAGNYTDNLNLVDIKGTGPNDRLTIDGVHPDSVKMIRGLNNLNTVISFDGANYITIKNMRVENFNTSGEQFGIHFTGNSQYDSIVNVRVLMSPTATFNVSGIGASADPANDFAEGNNANHVTVMDCDITGGDYSIHFEGANGNWNVGNHFINNRMTNFDANSHYFDDQDSLMIINDSAINPRNAFSDGMYIFDAMNFDIEENFIHVGDWAFYMTNANAGRTPDRFARIVNNMITSDTDYGVYLTNPLQVNFWHNSVYTGSASTFGPAARFADFGFIDSIDLRNNIFYGENTYALDYEGDSSTLLKCDFNAYQSNATNLLEMDFVNYANLAAYQVAQPIFNTFSVEGDPQYLDKLGGDLHINGTLVNDAGDNAVSVLTDIDGDVRPSAGATFVDIGADEFDPPPCPAPLGIRAFNIAPDSATIEWISSVLGNNVEVEVVVSGLGRGNGTLGSSTVDSINVDTLTSNTTYDIYIREICGRGDTSSWVGPTTFSTPCDAFSPRYFDNWDVGHLANQDRAPDCWYGYSTQVNGDVEIQNFNAFSTPNVLVLESWTGTADSAIAITPRMPKLTNGNTFIEFQFATQDINSSLIIGTASRPSNGATFTNMDTISLTSVNAYTKITFDISTANGYNGTDEYIVFSHDYGSTFDDLRIDDFTWDTIPFCRPVQNPTASNLSDTTADINWTPSDTNGTAWIIEWDSVGGNTPNDTQVTTRPFTLTGLVANTDYEFRVRAVCGAIDTSLWSSYVQFTTLCAPFSARHFENFDGMATNVMAECWTSYYTSASGNIAEPQVEFLGAGAFSANNSLEFTSWNMVHPTDSTIMWTPLYDDMTAGNKQVQFWTQTNDTLLYMIVGTSDQASNLANFNILDTIFYDANNVWQQEIVTLDTANGYNGTDRFVYFRNSLTSTFDDIRIDDYEYDVIPSCPTPRDLAIDSLGADTVIYTWSDPAGASTWQVRWGRDTTAIDNRTVELTTTRPDTLDGLDPNTFYEVQVRPICAVGDTGAWSAILRFRTGCDAFTAPFFANFDNEIDNTVAGCWGEYITWTNNLEQARVENFNSRSLPNNLELNSWTGYVVGSDTLGAWTPEFSDMPDGDKQLRFWYRSNDILNSGVIVMTADERSPSANFTVIDTIYPAANATYEEVTVKLDSANGYNGTDKHVFLAHTLTALGTFDEINIDDFNYEDIPTCQRVDQIAVTNVPTGDSIFVSFNDPNLNTVAYIVEYDTAGFTQGTGDTVIITGNPDTITGLMHSTKYQLYITTICAGGDTSNLSSNAFGFQTTCQNYPAPHFEDFNDTPQDSIPLCWTKFISYGAAQPNAVVEVSYFGFPAPFNGGSLYMNSWTGFTAGTSRMNISTPPLDSMTTGGMRLNLEWNTDNILSGIVVGTVPDLNPLATITPLDTLIMPVANNWTSVTVDITTANGYNGTDEHIIFAHTLGGTFHDVVIDNFDYEEIPSCIRMSNARAFNVGADSAMITWDDPNVNPTLEYIVEYDVAGFALGTGTTFIATNDTATITGLVDGTSYDFYVTAVCTIGDTSAISDVANFFTTCLPFTAQATLPWVESWETSNGDQVGSGFIVCDSAHSWFLGTSEPEGRASYGTNASAVSSGNGAVTLDVTTNGIQNINRLILTIDLSQYGQSTDLELSFDMRDHGDEDHPGDSVLMRASPNHPWVGVMDVGNVATAVFTRYTFDIDNLLGNDTVTNQFQVMFGQEDNFAAVTDGITYDSIRITGTIPVCEPPTALDTNFVAMTSAGVTWTDLNGSGVTYEVQYDSAGFTLGTGMTKIVSTDTTTLSGLTTDSNGTMYEWYVRTICGPGDTSVWSVVDTFITLPISIGLDEFDKVVEHFSVTPNPSNGLFNLSIGTLSTENFTMKVRDVKGQIVHEEQVNVNGTYQDQFDFRGFAKGVYYLEVRTENANRIEKLVIQ